MSRADVAPTPRTGWRTALITQKQKTGGVRERGTTLLYPDGFREETGRTPTSRSGPHMDVAHTHAFPEATSQN
jgi:hypothetical protein